ncbi:hypothetical protein NXS19_011515 [Fusarium pseudograminearum]|nr:hypothetical protein NXS19_011515 [Fusarium pseudograminearum]
MFDHKLAKPGSPTSNRGNPHLGSPRFPRLHTSNIVFLFATQSQSSVRFGIIQPASGIFALRMWANGSWTNMTRSTKTLLCSCCFAT